MKPPNIVIGKFRFRRSDLPSMPEEYPYEIIVFDDEHGWVFGGGTTQPTGENHPIEILGPAAPPDADEEVV